VGRFDEQVVLITGASSGIGEALAREVARQGAAVALLARRADRLARLSEEIHAAGRDALAVGCDVANEDDLRRAADLTLETFGRIDVAVANAGFGVVGRIERLTVEDFRRQFEVNVLGVVRTLLATLPALKQTGGTFVIVGSVAGYLPGSRTSPYAASKAALISLAGSLRAELAPAGVAVVLITPGYVASEIRKVDNHGRLHADARDQVPAWLVMPSAKAARAMARAIAARRREKVITVHGKLGVFLGRHAHGLVVRASTRYRRPRHEPGHAEEA
jgi:short-subunit dehydrogenase